MGLEQLNQLTKQLLQSKLSVQLKNNLLYGHKNSQLNCGLMMGNMNTGAYRGVDFDTGILGTVGNTDSHTTGIQGQVWVWKLTGLTAGNPVTSIGINAFATAGNIRVKAYDDDGGAEPENLLAESGSTAVTAGFNDVAVSGLTVPSDGILWFGFEADGGTVDIFFEAVQVFNVGHTYGTGPDPYGVPSTGNNNRWNMRITN